MLSILVLDATNRNRGKEITENFFSDEVAIYFYEGEYTHLFDGKKFIYGNLPDAINLLVLHNNDEGSWKELQKEADITVRYTGGDITEKTDESKGIYWIQRSVVKGTEIDKKDADEITNWAKDKIENRETSIPHILRDSSNSYLTALSILCQGYLAAHGAKYILKGWDEVWNKLSEKIRDDKNPYQLVEDKRKNTEAKRWWKGALGADQAEILKELNATPIGKNAEKEKVQALIDTIYNEDGDTLPNGELVAETYTALESILMGMGR